MANEKITEIVANALEKINAASNVDELVELKNAFLGKKSELSSMTSIIGTLPNEEKKSFGAAIHEAKEKISFEIENKLAIFKEKELNEKFYIISISMPSQVVSLTSLMRRPIKKTAESIYPYIKKDKLS